MKLIINVKEKETATKEVDEFRKKKYEGKDIRFINTNLMKLNSKLRKPIFYKNDLYINSETLWELMQPQGQSGTHNYHELTPEDIVTALNYITEPYALFEAKYSRYAIITTTLSHFDEQLMIVIEIGSRLYSDLNANINKIVSIYPKKNVDKILNNLNGKNVLLYKK